MRSWFPPVVAVCAAACAADKPSAEPPVEDEGTGIIGTGLANPFPNAALLDESGSLSLRDLPLVGGAENPVERLAWRDGFSPAQVSVLRLPELSEPAFVPEGLPSYLDIRPGEGSVRMYDLSDQRQVACFAELDAFPNPDEVALLVRPLEALPVGHRIAVVVTTELIDRPERFDALLSGDPPASLASVADAYEDLVSGLVALGVAEEEIALAWEFPIGDGAAPLRSALSQIPEPSQRPTFTRIREADAGDTVAPYTWRAAEGSYKAPQFLVDDLALDLTASGAVNLLGETDAYLYVHVPQSVKDAPEGSVPVMVFGHGIFGSPALYLDDADDPSSVLRLVEEAGFIVVATNWRGLTYDDRNIPISVAQDFTRFHELTDLMVQGQVNVRTLLRGISSGVLLDDPVFNGASGQHLPDPSQIFYYGISLGAIEGAVMLAHDDPPLVDGAVLHVGGASWSTMLERSSNWSAFELIIGGSIPNEADRQVLYALSQLWWDPIDPMSYVEPLSSRPLLLQESIGDEQVPNLTTEAFARSIGLPVLQPVGEVPFGLTGVSGPLPPGSRALVRFDPMLPSPDESNRPAAVTGAHGTPRNWPGARLQTIDALRPGLEGQVVHHCGSAPCDAGNPGVDP